MPQPLLVESWQRHPSATVRTSVKSRANNSRAGGQASPFLVSSSRCRSGTQFLRTRRPEAVSRALSEPDTHLDATIHPSQPRRQRGCRELAQNLAGKRPRRGGKRCRQRTRHEPGRSDDPPKRASFRRHPKRGSSEARACAGGRRCRHIAPRDGRDEAACSRGALQSSSCFCGGAAAPGAPFGKVGAHVHGVAWL